MEVEKKVETLEGEVKLMKGELKETLANVRDFLLSLKLPPPTVEGLDLAEVSQLGIGGGLPVPSTSSIPQPARTETVEAPRERAVSQPVEPEQPSISPVAEAEAPAQFVEVEELPEPPASELPEQQEPPPLEEEDETEQVAEQETAQVSPLSPRVNLLGNLFRWVSVATKEIGNEQLPTFLDIYSTSGNLSPELRGVILRFAGVVEEQPSDARAADIWSRLMNEQLTTFLDVYSVNGHISPEAKRGILHFASVMAEQSQDAHTAGTWNQLMSGQLATFLEVHTANGQLSPEVKEGVLRFIDAMAPKPVENNKVGLAPESVERNVADVWSRLILELHGILSGGSTLLHPLAPVQDATESEAEVGDSEVKEDSAKGPTGLEADEPGKPQEEKSMTLKLVLPDSDGVEKEFSIEKLSINLTPAAGEDNSLGPSSDA